MTYLAIKPPSIEILEPHVPDIADKLAALEEHLRQYPQQDCPLKHIFTDGVYVREIFIPAGTIVVGKIHRHDHYNFVTRGDVTVVTKDGRQRLRGPVGMVSTKGTKRALIAHTDVVWTTIHANPTNETDLDRLEALIIAPTYEALACEPQLTLEVMP